MAIHGGRQNATITHFVNVKFVTTVFPLCMAEGIYDVSPGPHESQSHHGIEQTVKTNSSIRQFFANGSVEDCRFESSERYSCRGHALCHCREAMTR